ncbi:MAG: hypothetical protein M1832_004029 [Thelocarpon impressellum]|nr:MAG: hypothetical protein M1832_004029 [Thelocarpon impressellum]
MSLASRIQNLLTPNSSGTPTSESTGTSGDVAFEEEHAVGHGTGIAEPRSRHRGHRAQNMADEEIGEAEESRPPYLHCMLAGGIGGTTGDLLMHSLDTVKTRQQGDPHIPPKYTSMSTSYATILRQEGIRRGLYGGVFPAFLGSFPGTIIFFGTYEYSKRHLLDAGVNAPMAYLAGGFLADFAASFVYVPSEVLKTRLQLQGRYNNPFFQSGYNYRSTLDATRTIIRQEGVSALFYGYKATIFRDLPFSALQFAFYEQGRTWAKEWVGHKNIGLPLEILTGAAAGGLAGVITCPLDVVKTRIQTQLHPTDEPVAAEAKGEERRPSRPKGVPEPAARPQSAVRAHRQTRLISTSSPSTATPRRGAMNLDTSSALTGLRLIYKAEGIAGWFRGVGPRFVWTGVQSGTMLVLYQALLRQLEAHPLVATQDGSPVV